MSNILKNISVRVAELAEQASRNGTFGVGGILVDESGKIIKEMKNQVLKNGHVNDPTAHVERQIVDWYFEKMKDNFSYSESHKMTIISSLDPCMMCTGSILAAGFNVISLNLDDMAGVNFDGKNTFDTLPISLKLKAASSFGYCGHSHELKQQGSIPHFLSPPIIEETVKNRAFKAFFNNLADIRDLINRTSFISPDYPQIMDNLAADPAQKEFLNEIKKQSPYFLSLRHVDPLNLPNELGDILIKEAKTSFLKGAKLNAAALVDKYGNLLVVDGGNEQISPIRSAFMQLTRHYAQLRFSLAKIHSYRLPAPKDCCIILLKGPGHEASDIADLGAFGSTMEGTMSSDFEHLQYIIPAQSQRALDDMMGCFPPLYRDIIKVRPVGVQSSALIKHCVAALK